MKRLLILVIILSFAIFNCAEVSEKSADLLQKEQTDVALSEAQRQIGMPNITNFQQKKMMKWIFELADDEDLITYTYIIAQMTGKLVFVGKSIGYGVPFSAQFTNPEKIVEGDKQIGYDLAGKAQHLMQLPQADPNGLFMPTSSSATWVIMIDPNTGEPRPQYWEPELVISPFPLSPVLGPNAVIGIEANWGK